ncbi:MAG: hypothetical protein V4703_06075, partial [Actinomycetota bacterium]
VEAGSEKTTAVRDGAEGERIGGHVIPPRPADPAPDGHSAASRADSAPRYGERVEPSTPVAPADSQEAAEDTQPASESKSDDEGPRDRA